MERSYIVVLLNQYTQGVEKIVEGVFFVGYGDLE